MTEIIFFSIKKILIFLIICIALPYTNLQAQTNLTKQDNNHIFKGWVDGLVGDVDENQYMKSFQVGIKWSVYLGEPVESYSFKWEANNSFRVKIDGNYQTFTREQLSEFPELIKRLDAVTPVKANVLVYGKAEGNSVTIPMGDLPSYSHYYSANGGSSKVDGQAYEKHQLLASFIYTIGDEHLLFGKKGENKSGAVVGVSPEWNNFIQWQGAASYTNDDASIKAPSAIVENYNEAEFNNFSEDKKKRFNAEFKHIYKNLTAMRVYAELETLSWDLQLQNIAESYLRYKEEGKKPSPKEQLAKAMEEENVANISQYRGDEFWGKAPDLKEPEFEADYIDDNYWFIKIKNTETITHKGKYAFVSPVPGLTDKAVFVVTLNDSRPEKYYNNWERFIDAYGNKVLEKDFNDFEIFEDGIIKIDKKITSSTSHTGVSTDVTEHSYNNEIIAVYYTTGQVTQLPIKQQNRDVTDVIHKIVEIYDRNLNLIDTLKHESFGF